MENSPWLLVVRPNPRPPGWALRPRSDDPRGVPRGARRVSPGFLGRAATSVQGRGRTGVGLAPKSSMKACDFLVVGGGAAGLSAAAELCEAGARVLHVLEARGRNRGPRFDAQTEEVAGAGGRTSAPSSSTAAVRSSSRSPATRRSRWSEASVRASRVGALVLSGTWATSGGV